jgi:hypothetical protein
MGLVIRPPLYVVPNDAPPPSTLAPAVLTPSMQERLASINAATRALRELGLHVIWSKLAGPIPQAHIRRDGAVSMAPLMDRMGPRSFRHEGGCTVVSGEFMGVLVSWLEPNPQ